MLAVSRERKGQPGHGELDEIHGYFVFLDDGDGVDRYMRFN
jgi:hypothetical protein